MVSSSNKRGSRKPSVKKKGCGLINTLINKLPVELHIPGYHFCGPGTRLQKRLKRGDPGINLLNRMTSLRHRADKLLADKALQRFRSKDASFGVAGIMKGKRKLGMGHRKKIKKGGKIKSKRANLIAAVKRTIPTPKKGGFIPLLPIVGALGALGSVRGGAAAIAKAVKDSKTADATLAEQRHNLAMEAMKGKGLYLRPYKKGGGLYLKPYKTGGRLNPKSKN